MTNGDGAATGHSNGAGGLAGSTADRRTALDWDQAAAELDQTASDADQTASDADQTAVDADQAASEQDQAASDADQAASDADQAASDADQAAADRETEATRGDASTPDVLQAARERALQTSRAQREDSTAARAANAAMRTQTAAERFDSAEHRDETARLRDVAAEARDRAAEVRDRLAAAGGLGPAAALRAHAARDRARAAADRERAARDREQAASDREHARAALVDAHVDELTGSYRRGIGTLALRREIDRAHRSGEGLVLAFVDVDRLKEINDREGHAAGDVVLSDLVATIRSHLRSYDPVVRFGGDEFLCALSDVDLESARSRFEEIKSALRELRADCSISVGLAVLRDDDSLDGLTARADAALYETKRGA